MATTLEHFEVLSKNGLEVIPLHPGEKVPVYYAWQKDYDPAHTRWHILSNPDCNLGIRLGRVLDVEGDTTHANAVIDSLVHGVEHPMYQSRKSVHHLFLNPFRDLTRITHNGVEFRGHYHQSVVPPSVVKDTEYHWLSVDFPLRLPPPALLKYLERLRIQCIGDVKPGHVKLPCYTCRKIQYLHRKRFELELKAFHAMGSRWLCRSCRTVDLRPMCRQIRNAS